MLKAIFQKIASWFKAEAKTAEQDAIELASQAGTLVQTDLATIRAGASHFLSDQPEKDKTMSTPVAVPTATTATNTTVDTAIKIALALKAIDANLTDAAVQAGTNAALATLYPAA